MKRVASAMTVLLLVFAAGNAKAASLAPPSVSFNAIGSLSIASVVGNLNCSATMSGSIDDYGVGQITNIQLSGGPLNSCAASQAANLPYTFIANGNSSGYVTGLSITGGLVPPRCGPYTAWVTFLMPGSFRIEFGDTGICRGTLLLQSHPQLRTVN